jgi:hypothetical protein
MITPDELARQIVVAARTGDGYLNILDYATVLIARRDEMIRQDEIGRCANMWSLGDPAIMRHLVDQRTKTKPLDCVAKEQCKTDNT